MRRFVNYYHFYLRVVTYGLPFLSFGAARYLLRSVGHPDTGLDRYSYFNLLLFMTVIWAIVSEYYRVTSVQEPFPHFPGPQRDGLAFCNSNDARRIPDSRSQSFRAPESQPRFCCWSRPVRPPGDTPINSRPAGLLPGDGLREPFRPDHCRR